MRFLPLTRQVELELSNPEKVVSASPGTFFYRKGNSLFFSVSRDFSSRERIEISKRRFATLKYQNEIWYATVKDVDIIFENEYEIWQKTGNTFGNTGWVYISNKKIETLMGPSPT